MSCLGSFFYPKLAGRRGCRPAGWQPALADAGVDFSGLPTDRPVNFDDIEALQRRAGGGLRLRAAANPVDPPAARPKRHERRPAHRAASPAQRPLQPDPQLPGAGQQVGADPGSHAHQHRRLRRVQVPTHMARFATKASWQRHRATQCYREIAERTRKAPLPGPEKSLLRYRGKASAELAPLACYADLDGFFLLCRRRALRLRATQGAEAEAHAPRAGQRQVPRRPRHAERPSQAGRPLPHLETQNSARQHDPAGGAGAQGRHSLRDRREEAPPLPRHRAVSRGAVPLLQHRGPDAQDHPSGLSQRAATTSCCATLPRWALLSAGHRVKSSARTATTRALRARQKEARGPCPWPRLRQSPTPRPRPGQGPSPAGAGPCRPATSASKSSASRARSACR